MTHICGAAFRVSHVPIWAAAQLRDPPLRRDQALPLLGPPSGPDNPLFQPRPACLRQPNPAAFRACIVALFEDRCPGHGGRHHHGPGIHSACSGRLHSPLLSSSKPALRPLLKPPSYPTASRATATLGFPYLRTCALTRPLFHSLRNSPHLADGQAFYTGGSNWIVPHAGGFARVWSDKPARLSTKPSAGRRSPCPYRMLLAWWLGLKSPAPHRAWALLHRAVHRRFQPPC